MANRLTKIYTRTGDEGTTGTADGSRLAKDSLLIQVQGDLDELNCMLGLLAVNLAPVQRELVFELQHVLFDIGGEISLGQHMLADSAVKYLEELIDSLNESLQPLQEFILPGGNESGARCHLARAVCRRLERHMVSLADEHGINPVSLAYINRLSDFLFVYARILNDGDEILWNSSRMK